MIGRRRRDAVRPVRISHVEAKFVMDLLGVTRPTLEKLIKEMGLPCTYLTPRLRRFELHALYEWIDSRWSARPADSEAVA